MTIKRDRLVLSFWPTEGATRHVIQLGITDQSWHQVCVTWLESANGEWAVYVDAELLHTSTGYGSGNELNRYMYIETEDKLNKEKHHLKSFYFPIIFNKQTNQRDGLRSLYSISEKTMNTAYNL